MIDSGETVIWIDPEGYFFGETVTGDSKAGDGQIHANYFKDFSYFRQESVCGHEWSYMLQNSKKMVYEISLEEVLQ